MSIAVLQSLAANLTQPDVAEWMEREVRVRVGIDARRGSMRHGAGEVFDAVSDAIVVAFDAKKRDIAAQVIRDLIAVECVVRWLRWFLIEEPQWSPYP